MRHTLFLALLPALLSACAGPRLSGPASTARLPAPAVRRIDTPAPQIEAALAPVKWIAEPAAVCDT